MRSSVERVTVLSMVWWTYLLAPGFAQYADMVCEKQNLRNGRKMTEPGPECDMNDRNWCTVKTSNYPEEMLMEVILDNRGIMKRLFGDQREARFLEDEFNSYNDLDNMPPPLRLEQKGKFNKWLEDSLDLVHEKLLDANAEESSRKGKKIEFNKWTDMNLDRHHVFEARKESAGIKETRPIEEKGKLYKSRNKNLLSNNNSTNISQIRTNDKVFVSNFDIEFEPKKSKNSNNGTMDITLPALNSINIDTSAITATAPSNNEATTVTDGLITATYSEQIFTTTEISPFSEQDVKDYLTLTEDVETPLNYDVDVKEINTERTEEIQNNEEGTDSYHKSEPSSTVNSTHSAHKNTLNSTVTSQNSPSDLKMKPADTIKSDHTEHNKHGNTAQSETNKLRTEQLEGRVEFHSRFQQIPSRTRPSALPQRHEYQNKEHHSLTRESTTIKAPIADREDKHREDDNIKNTKSSNPSVLEKPPKLEKFQACNSTSELIAPTWAKNIKGKNLIVVNVGSFMQHLHIEECDKEALYRKMFCQRGCRCEQQYRLQKLLVVDPDDECRGIFSDWFRFPSSCVCVCYPASFASASKRDGRIIEDDDEYIEDIYDDDLDDPQVRHYYGLDLVEKDEELQMVASNVPSLKSSEKENIVDWSLNGHFSSNDHSIESLNDAQKLLEGNPSKYSTSDLHRNTTKMVASRSKKSRLLRGFENIGAKRARMIPVRFSSKALIPSYARPWMKSHPQAFWPSIALIRYLSNGSGLEHNSLSANMLQRSSIQFPSKNNGISSTAYSSSKTIPEFSHFRQWTNIIKEK